jgi:hypothetical protein
MAFFKKKKRKEKVDVLKDTTAIIEFLEDIQTDIDFLRPKLLELEELEKEQEVASDKLKPTNISTQVKILDKLLERYEFFESDIVINGQRLKMIAGKLLSDAQKAGLKKLVKQKRNSFAWK